MTTFLEKDRHNFKQLWGFDFEQTEPDLARCSPEVIAAERKRQKINVIGRRVWSRQFGYGRVTTVFNEPEIRDRVVGIQFDAGNFEVLEINEIVPTYQNIGG